MLASFVIALREGVEASLVVGILGAFLARHGSVSARRAMWVGVALAGALCLAVGAGLQVLHAELPERGQEVLEATVSAVAVVVVTFMIVWMRRHAGELAGRLRTSAAGALATGSTLALVAMAFFAVLREGFEAAVFLLASFQESSSPVTAGLGAVMGLATAVVIGWSVDRCGRRLDLRRFLTVTAVLLVVIAAGLVTMTIHTVLEMGWIGVGTNTVFDLGRIAPEGSITSSLLTGVLGLHTTQTAAEIAGWLVYAIPMLVFVMRPRRPRPSPQTGLSAGTA